MLLLAGVAGFGPTNARVKVWCLTAWLYPIIFSTLQLYHKFTQLSSIFFTSFHFFQKYIGEEIPKEDFLSVFLIFCKISSQYPSARYPVPGISGRRRLRPFNPREKVIEYLIEDEAEAAARERLVRMTCKGFAHETASESPAPGGGSISAYMGALGAALGTMVANLSSHKAGWDSRWEEFSNWAEKGQAVMDRLLALVDEDTSAFDRIMAAIGMPKGSEEEKAARAAALEAATLYATEVPLKTMKAALEVFPIVKAMAEDGNPASVSDAGVGALAARSAVLGAQLNVRINAAGLADRAAAERLCAEASEIAAQAAAAEAEVLEIVNERIA